MDDLLEHGHEVEPAPIRLTELFTGGPLILDGRFDVHSISPRARPDPSADGPAWTGSEIRGSHGDHGVTYFVKETPAEVLAILSEVPEGDPVLGSSAAGAGFKAGLGMLDNPAVLKSLLVAVARIRPELFASLLQVVSEFVAPPPPGRWSAGPSEPPPEPPADPTVEDGDGEDDTGEGA